MTPESKAAGVPAASVIRWLNDLSTIGVFTTDRALNVCSWNRWLVRATARTEQDAVGQPLFELFPELTSRGIARYYDAAMRGEGIMLSHHFHHHLLEIATPAGRMLQTSRISPLLDGDTIVGTVTMIEDVTERVNSEAELRRQIAVSEQAREAAEAAARVKDEFLATLSHELRTPLNAVVGWTRILRGTGLDQETMERALQVIERNVEAQTRLIDDLLDVSRIAAGKLRLELRPVDLGACTLAAIDVVTPAATAKDIAIERHLRPTATLINADGDRVQQVVWNLLANAVKFTPRGGRVTVRMTVEDGMARVTVADTGKGISPQFIPRVFERFSQANSSTSRTEGGLGLGLALARQLTELHGGDISVHSDGLGLGAVFTVAFPLLVDQPAAAPAEWPAASQQLAGRTVLLVEDRLDWADVLSRTLGSHGARVQLVTTSQDALDLLAQERPDVIVADIGLSGEDGYAFMRRYRETDTGQKRVPAIAVTAYAGKQHRDRAFTVGYDAYQPKPVSPNDVVGLIVSILKS